MVLMVFVLVQAVKMVMLAGSVVVENVLRTKSPAWAEIVAVIVAMTGKGVIVVDRSPSSVTV